MNNQKKEGTPTPTESVKKPTLEDFQAELYAELRKLTRPAIVQAKRGKPALLRILCRAVPRPDHKEEEPPEPQITFDLPRPNRN